MEEILYDEYQGLAETHWWFIGRSRLLRRWLAEESKEGPQRRILDVGCGAGGNFSLLAPYGKLVGVDQRIGAIDPETPQHASLCRADLNALPFPPQSFDIVSAFEVIEHIKDDVSFLRELHGLLKPGGSLWVSVPAYMSLWGPHDVLAHHQRRYNRKRLRSAVEAAGFIELRLSAINWILLPAMWVYRWISRRRNPNAPTKSDFALSGQPGLNAAFKLLFSLEQWTVGRQWPFGATLLLKAHKPK